MHCSRDGVAAEGMDAADNVGRQLFVGYLPGLVHPTVLLLCGEKMISMNLHAPPHSSRK